MKKLDVLAAVLVVVGALNWGLVGVARFDLVATLFGLRGLCSFQTCTNQNKNNGMAHNRDPS